MQSSYRTVSCSHAREDLGPHASRSGLGAGKTLGCEALMQHAPRQTRGNCGEEAPRGHVTSERFRIVARRDAEPHPSATGFPVQLLLRLWAQGVTA